MIFRIGRIKKKRDLGPEKKRGEAEAERMYWNNVVGRKPKT